MNNYPIGIIDSGIGGVSVWKEIIALLPQESTVYLSDAKNLPYGEKSEEEVYYLAKRLVEYLKKANMKLIVIACNTITVTALDKLRIDFPDIPIVGTVPVVKSAAKHSENKHIGILSTSRTAQSAYQKHLIEQFASDCVVLNLGTNMLVPMIESGVIDQDVLRHELHPFIEANIDALALGCTHFPFLKTEIQKIMGDKVEILDSGAAVARQVERILEKERLFQTGHARHTAYTTGNLEQFRMLLETLGGRAMHDKIQEIKQLAL